MKTKSILISCFGVAACALTYQFAIMIGLTFILGDTITIFSILTGTYLFAMGISTILISRFGARAKEILLLQIQFFLGLFGCFALLFLFFLYAFGVHHHWPTTSILWAAGLFLQFILGLASGSLLPLINKRLSARHHSPELLGKILGFDYLGGFLGAVLFPTVLLPEFGILRGTFLASAANALMIVLYLFATEFKVKRAAFLSIFILILSLSLFTQGHWLEDQIDGLIYAEN